MKALSFGILGIITLAVVTVLILVPFVILVYVSHRFTRKTMGIFKRRPRQRKEDDILDAHYIDIPRPSAYLEPHPSILYPIRKGTL